MARMLSTILKNLGSGPATRLYPHQVREPFKDVRGRLLFNPETCILCSLCEKSCPAAALEVKRKEGTFTFFNGRCVTCGACVDACPRECLTMARDWRKPKTGLVPKTWHIELKKKNEKNTEE